MSDKQSVTHAQARDLIKDLSAAELEALSMAAVGQDGWLRPTRFKRLVALGLVEEYEDRLYGVVSGGTVFDRVPVRVKRFQVPLPVHMAWTEACVADTASRRSSKAEDGS